MPLTNKQKNIVIGYAEQYITEFARIGSKVQSRKDRFIQNEGDKTAPFEKDITKLSLSELKTKKTTLSKLHAEIVNIESQITFDLLKTDMEIVKRNA